MHGNIVHLLVWYRVVYLFVCLCDDGGKAGLIEALMVCIWLLVSLPVLQFDL